ncbi:MAG: pyridoxal phosphate-dependent aminotransferase [Bacteroidia bacterium]|nr:pyridoxal phosphate-dependent aminotransferase [Bacteroidia bacterium]
MRMPSDRMQRVQPPIIPVIGELIQAYSGTISLGQGVVYYGPPEESLRKIKDFYASPNNHKYQAVEGLPALHKKIAEKLRAENGITVDASNRLVVSAGGNMGFSHAVLAITDPGDEIILPVPFYFNHEMAVSIAGCKPVLVPTDASYQLQPELIRKAITPRTRAIVTVSPNNPAGVVYPEKSLRLINDICREHEIFHISDEAYEYFNFDYHKHFSAASIPQSAGHTISLFSMSKAYGFASWRIGYMVIPAHLYESVRKIQDTQLICPPVISQFAAMGALDAGKTYFNEKFGVIRKSREIFQEALHEVRDICEAPRTSGAFYTLIKPKTRMTSLALAERLIREFRVAVIPGEAFGMEEECGLRVSFGAVDEVTAREGIGRLVKGLTEIVG